MGISTNQIFTALVIALVPALMAFKLGKGLYNA